MMMMMTIKAPIRIIVIKGSGRCQRCDGDGHDADADDDDDVDHHDETGLLEVGAAEVSQQGLS